MIKSQLSNSWLTWAIAAAFVVVAMFGVTTYNDIVSTRQEAAQIARSQAVREVARELLSSIKDMESGQRGFLLTGDEIYLEPYHTGLTHVSEEFVELKRLTESDPVQKVRVNSIDGLFQQKKELLAETIAKQMKFVKRGLNQSDSRISAESLEVVLSGRGKMIMDDIRRELDDLLQEESRLLAIRQADASDRALRSKRMIVGGNLLALFLLVISGTAAWVDRKQRDEAVAKLLEKQSELLRAQRLETIGTLTGGIAHDLNNLLTPILMNAKLIQRDRGDIRNMADNIVLSAQRGSELIGKLLAFAGGGGQQFREQVDVVAIIDEAKEILQHALPKSIELHVDIEKPLHPVAGDATELSQVIMNLAINARDAMPDGGRLELKAANFFVDRHRAERRGNLQSGPHVLIAVVDQGTGIPKEIIDKIFDPFFTTKPQGKGTGLGLATSLGIIRKHRGDMTVHSDPGHGACFSILLPSIQVAQTRVAGQLHDVVRQGNGETILLVDDEPMILEVARATLESSGYRVETATSGEQAIAKLQQNGGMVDAVLLDMMMPGLDGIQTRQGIREINHDVPIIISSGLRRPGQKDGAELENFEAFLAKPYSVEQLLGVITRVLNRKSVSSK
jgi:signal transduction histidine kinase/ActR/RegA family two-component response regulator